MGLRHLELSSLFGTRILPFNNARVVCPPGTISPKGRPNIIIATPMRSGTHVLIDVLLNNLPDYRNGPLYVDLDKAVMRARRIPSKLTQVTPDAGYVLKTHMPLNTLESMPENPHVLALLEAGTIITVKRSLNDICRSLTRWTDKEPEALKAEYGREYDRFWAFWAGRAQIALDFRDLFDTDRMQAVLDELARQGGSQRAKTYRPPPKGLSKAQMYTSKTLTRLLGCRAPQINTTIHTLKT